MKEPEQSRIQSIRVIPKSEWLVRHEAAEEKDLELMLEAAIRSVIILHVMDGERSRNKLTQAVVDELGDVASRAGMMLLVRTPLPALVELVLMEMDPNLNQFIKLMPHMSQEQHDRAKTLAEQAKAEFMSAVGATAAPETGTGLRKSPPAKEELPIKFVDVKKDTDEILDAYNRGELTKEELEARMRRLQQLTTASVKSAWLVVDAWEPAPETIGGKQYILQDQLMPEGFRPVPDMKPEMIDGFLRIQVEMDPASPLTNPAESWILHT